MEWGAAKAQTTYEKQDNCRAFPYTQNEGLCEGQWGFIIPNAHYDWLFAFPRGGS